MSEPLLVASNLCKTFTEPHKTPLFRDVSFRLGRGESMAITGRSGIGKTTLLHILGTLEPFDSGELLIAGQKTTPGRLPKLRNQHIGFVFQSFNLLEDFTALDNVLMPSCIGRRPMSPDKGLELLDAVGLRARAHFPARLLSGGEKQRVAIARALSNNPDILLADEPSGNLDPANAEAVLTLLFDLTRSHNKALILVTHDLTIASRCNHHYVLAHETLSPHT